MADRFHVEVFVRRGCFQAIKWCFLRGRSIPRRGFCTSWLLSCDKVVFLSWSVDSTERFLYVVVAFMRHGGCATWWSGRRFYVVGIVVVFVLRGGWHRNRWEAGWWCRFYVICVVVCGGKRTEVQRKRMGRATWVPFSLSATTTTTKEGEAWMEGKTNGRRERRGSRDAMEKAKRMNKKRRLETKTMKRGWKRLKGGRRRGEKTSARVGKEWRERKGISRGKQNAIMGWTERQHGQIAKRQKGIKLTWI